jgi:phosphoserine / homoserine phosphotransferase
MINRRSFMAHPSLRHRGRRGSFPARLSLPRHHALLLIVTWLAHAAPPTAEELGQIRERTGWVWNFTFTPKSRGLPRCIRVTNTVSPVKQCIVTLDMEGVLTPEIWIAVAERTGIPDLRRTTRDEPDYDKLMRYRLEILDRHGITLSRIQQVIGGLEPLPGAVDFLDALRAEVQLIILSDTFEQFAQPLMRSLKWPTLFCHRLEVHEDRITGYQLRMPDQKRESVRALRSINFKVIAAGDSYNDTSMLGAADHGFLFHAPENVVREFPQFPALGNYPSLLAAIRAQY